MMPFLVYMHGTRLTIGKPFIRKQYNALVFLVVSATIVEVPIEQSEDCYCDLSVPRPNGYTISCDKNSQVDMEKTFVKKYLHFLLFLRQRPQLLFCQLLDPR